MIHYTFQLGMVQLLGVPQHCPVKLMILTWNNQQFVGHVPSEQVSGSYKANISSVHLTVVIVGQVPDDIQTDTTRVTTLRSRRRDTGYSWTTT